MAQPVKQTETPGFWQETLLAISRGREVWGLVSRSRRRTLMFCAILMIITAAANTASLLWLGGLVDTMAGKPSVDALSRMPLWLAGSTSFAPGDAVLPIPIADGATKTISNLNRVATLYVLAIAFAYLLREILQVIRRLLIQNVCTQLDKEMTVQLVSRLLRIDLTRMGADRVGALHGRIHRSVEGFVKFLKLTFLDLSPAIFMAAFALWGTASKQPIVAVIMAGVIPVSLFLTARQLLSQRGIRLALLRKRESLDGTVVEQLGGLEYIRAANTLPIELARVEDAAEQRRLMEFQHHKAMTIFESLKAVNEGFFYIITIAFSIYLAVRGDISIGSIWHSPGYFSVLWHRSVRFIESSTMLTRVAFELAICSACFVNRWMTPMLHERCKLHASTCGRTSLKQKTWRWFTRAPTAGRKPFLMAWT